MTWTPEQRAYERGYVEGVMRVLDMLRDGCGDHDCGCEPRMTDCCERPQHGCHTTVVNDDVTVCRGDLGHHLEVAS